MSEELLAKIVDLESRIAFQEATIIELSDQLALQARDISAQQKHIQVINDKLNSISYDLDSPSKGGVVNERPPHY